MTLSSDDWAVNRLNTHSFETIWNGAPGEYTINLALTPIGQVYATGVVVLGNNVYGLPDGDMYMALAVQYRFFSNDQLLVPDTWISSDVVLANVQTLISVYSADGVTLPRNCVYLYKPSQSQTTILVIRYSACSKLFPNGVPALFVTTYRNPVPSAPILSWSTRIPSVSTVATIGALNTKLGTYLGTNTPGTLMTINGYDADPTGTYTWQVGDYVDLLMDPGVIAAYDAEVMTLNTGYLSNLYNEVRDLLHCPKNLNPNQWILTYEASFISLWDAAQRKGIMIPRLDPHCVKQVSHADWSIDRSVLQACKTFLGSTTVLARVRVRQPAEPHVLQPNSAQLQALYECPDAEITEHLLGSIDSAATFWKASALEQNPYIDLMFNTPTGSGTDASILSIYRQALGYHDMVAVLGETVQTGLKALQNIIITKPGYIENQSCYAMLFVGGRKIDSAAVTLLDLPHGKLAISVASSTPITLPNTFDVAITENAIFTAEYNPAASAGVVLSISSPYASVYKYVTFTTPITGWDGTVLTGGYVKVGQGSSGYQVYPEPVGAAGYTVNCMPALAGNALLIMDDIYTITTRIDLDPIITAGSPLIFPLQNADVNDVMVPVLNYGTVEVYINGRRLAEGLDYALLPWTDTVSGGVGRVDVIVSNQSYFDPTQSGNRIEIIVHSGIKTSQDVSYVLGQSLRRQVTPSFWNPALSRCFIEGLWIRNPSYHTDWFDMTGQSEGSVGYWETTIHRRLYELMKSYDPTMDYTNRVIVDKALNHVTPPIPSIVTLTTQHHLYSPYLSAIIAAVEEGSFTLVDDPDPRMFLQQFKQFFGIKSVDPSLATYTGPVDPNYVAISANYANYSTMSPTTLALIQRLVSYTLTPSATLGENLI